ncbi:MAG: PH domain-containing protein [Nocardioidaceae bacterium]|nr:PH domain-containing protein [Nocardioidaceae bacterium]NUS50534.1 PH domain-containing protein [Nocardioidaceae bacterium]
MAISRRLLNEDEHVVVSTRTHVKALLWPAVVLILIAGVAGYATSFTGRAGKAQPLLVAIIWAIAFVAACIWVLRAFFSWLTTTYTITNRRLITRTGILNRRGHDIPVPRISDVAYEHGLVDRLLGCGTLVISDASEQGRVRLHDIPHVERVHLELSELLFSHTDHHERGWGERRIDDGT